jgi:predicted regulator of Ras-like GTPase activity (Roadblock/LC7/MglB family)
VLRLRAVDPAQALADLTEISSQIEAAVLADANGAVLASTLATEKGERLARAAFGLVEAAETTSGPTKERLVQIEAATPEGSFFVVRDEARLAAAVTGPDPTSGLVFYDLKTCLRLVGEERPRGEETPSGEEGPSEKKTTRRRRPREEEEETDEGAA